ncbi:GNAT family N-acetyltransferase [Vibrio albus]|jgi:putative acetyltransferase|uniref:GNAT family N-acetyltransferase n=1 Tax=Vibrio albus TaxID=2200953 RepID=A0A2U3BEP2_9VIBR|nr:N-acetyltransferase [Vibrio albus]PWI35258.1 GNAT family N-acetyltransferase [Vibrio albus]
MLIRTEAPADILPVDRLLKSTFPTDAEANLVMRLRENGRLTLSLVACSDEGEVIGYVLFSPVLIDGEDIGWQGLAPVAVKEECRNQGVAAELIREGFESLRDFGYPACVVLGNPAYYSRFGFEDAAQYKMHCRWDVPAGAFQVIELEKEVFTGKQGLVEYCPEFSA